MIVMNIYSLTKQRGNKAVLLLIGMVGLIVGSSYLLKSPYGQAAIATVKSKVMPNSMNEDMAPVAESVTREPLTITPVNNNSTARSADVTAIGSYYHNSTPPQDYYSQPKGNNLSQSDYLKQRKHVPEGNESVPKPVPVTVPVNIFGYDVQLVSTKDEGAAYRLRDSLINDNYSAFIEPVWRGNVRMFRVKIGRYHHLEGASRVRDQIRRRYPAQFGAAIVISSDK